MKTSKQLRKEGYQAKLSGISCRQCPHINAGHARHEWLMGWYGGKYENTIRKHFNQKE